MPLMKRIATMMITIIAQTLINDWRKRERKASHDALKENNLKQ